MSYFFYRMLPHKKFPSYFCVENTRVIIICWFEYSKKLNFWKGFCQYLKERKKKKQHYSMNENSSKCNIKLCCINHVQIDQYIKIIVFTLRWILPFSFVILQVKKSFHCLIRFGVISLWLIFFNMSEIIANIKCTQHIT